MLDNPDHTRLVWHGLAHHGSDRRLVVAEIGQLAVAPLFERRDELAEVLADKSLRQWGTRWLIEVLVMVREPGFRLEAA